MVTKLSLQEEAVLEHLARFRLTLPALLAKADVFDDHDPSSAVAVLDSLAEKGWLGKALLNPGHTDEPYFHLSAKAARRLGHDPEFGKPLPRDLRIESYAIGTYCVANPSCKLLTKDEFKRHFQALWFPGQPVRYCLEDGEGTRARLAFLKVDGDGAGRWDRLIDLCSRFLRQRTDVKRASPEHRSHVEAFDTIVKRGQFHFSVLTALSDKKRAIELGLERRAAAAEAAPPIRVHVIPGLFELLFPGIESPTSIRSQPE